MNHKMGMCFTPKFWSPGPQLLFPEFCMSSAFAHKDILGFPHYFLKFVSLTLKTPPPSCQVILTLAG